MAKTPDDKNLPQQPDDGIDFDAVEAFVEEPASGAKPAADGFEALEEAVEEFAPEPAAGPTSAGPGSDSAINFGDEVAAGDDPSLSGVSVVEWASLAEEKPAPMKLDSSSDIDLLREERAAAAARGHGVTDADFDEDALAADLARPAATEIVSESDAAIDLGPEAVVIDEGGASAEAIDLSASASGGETSDVRLASDSGISGVESDVSLAPESGIDLMADDIVLEEPHAAGGSSRDLIAEGLESGVDLLGQQKKKAADDEDALDDFLANVGQEDPSSAVDLGSAHNIPSLSMDDYDSAAGPRSERAEVGAAAAASGSASDIDLAGMVDDEEEAKPRARATATAAPGAIDLADRDDDPDEAPPAPVKKKAKAKADPDADDEKPAKKAKPEKKGGGGWVGGTLLGGVLATAALMGAWTAGIDPPDALRDLAGTKVAKPNPLPGAGTGVPAQAAPPPVALGSSVRSGDLDAIKPEHLEKVDEAKPEELTARAQARWLLHVRQQRGKGLKADADPVKLALADLEKAVAAGSADALFLRAEIHKRTGNVAAAKADYETGAKKFADDADQKERFEAALDTLTLSTADARPAPAVPLAMLLVFGFQPPADAPKPPAEPAPRLARAVRLANEGKFAEAIKAVEEAKELHDERRSVYPNRPVNPRTDPSEETFLRACDELVRYYTLAQSLKDPAKLAARPQVQALVKKVEMAAAETVLKDLGEKLLRDKPVPTADELVKAVTAERKALADKAAELDGKLTAAKKDREGLEAKVKEATAALAAKDKALAAVLGREKDLTATNEAALGALKEVGEVVDFRFVDIKVSRPSLLRELRELKKAASTVDPKGELRRLEADREAMRAKLEGERDAIRTRLERERDAIRARLEGERDALSVKLRGRTEPAAMLATWLPVVDGLRDRADLAAKAAADAGRVLKDAAATPAQRAQAQALLGLVARNEERYDDARTTLTAALPALGGEWRAAAEAALKGSADPGGDVAGKAQALADAGKTKEALALLERGLKASAGNKGALYAQRGRIALERARSGGPLNADSPLVASAQRDAAEAAREGSAEGYYLAGRIAEETKDFAAALKQYREAVKQHGAADEAGARYKVALARVLLRMASNEGAAPRPVPPALRTGRLDVNGLSTLLTLALYAPDLPREAPATGEAERLADEVLALGDRASFDVRAQALAVKGLHTRALREYAAGLRDKGLLAPAYANDLLDLIDAHPALRRGDTRATPDPVEGEKSYAAGLRFFAAKRWADAEREFLAAVEQDGGDARYIYFLGLSRVAQGNRDGFEDFERAAALERAGRPDRAAVSAALERVQGPMRAVLNAARVRPSRDRVR